MEKILKTTASISGGVIFMFFIEGLVSLGAAFDFEKYTAFTWVVQAVFLVFVISFFVYLSIENDKHDK
jgi:hypothetical protein